MTSIAAHLFTSPQGALLMGLSLMLGLVTAGIAISFCFILRHRPLSLFGLTIFSLYIVIGIVNHDPTQIYDMNADPIFFRLGHFLAAMSLFCFYRLLITSNQTNAHNRISAKILFCTMTLALLARFAVIIFMNEILIKISSFLAVIFLIATICYEYFVPAKTRSQMLAKAGCILVCSLMIYPLIRTGIVAHNPVHTNLVILMLFILSAFSALWLAGLLMLAKESFINAETASLKNLARALIQLRDLMNTPLQTIEVCMALLRNKNPNETELNTRVDRSFERLRQINRALAKYENHVDWEQTDNFFDL